MIAIELQCFISVFRTSACSNGKNWFPDVFGQFFFSGDLLWRCWRERNCSFHIVSSVYVGISVFTIFSWQFLVSLSAVVFDIELSRPKSLWYIVIPVIFNWLSRSLHITTLNLNGFYYLFDLICARLCKSSCWFPHSKCGFLPRTFNQNVLVSSNMRLRVLSKEGVKVFGYLQFKGLP